jgi:hypothetical protein
MHYWIIQPGFPADMTEPDLNELFVKFSSCSLENCVLFKDVVLYREAEVLEPLLYSVCVCYCVELEFMAYFKSRISGSAVHRLRRTELMGNGFYI